MKLHDEMSNALLTVIEAENNAKSWNDEAKERMKTFNVLFTAANKLEGGTLEKKEVISAIRAELTPPESATEPATDSASEPDTETPDSAK